MKKGCCCCSDGAFQKAGAGLGSSVFQTEAGGEELLRIGVTGAGKKALSFVFFDDDAVVQNGDAVTEVAHDIQIMRNKEAGEVEIAAQALKKVQDLRLDAQIQGRNRLVRNQELGARDEGAADGRTLALTAGKILRKAFGDLRIESHGGEHFLHFPASLFSGKMALNEQGFFHLPADFLQGMQ